MKRTLAWLGAAALALSFGTAYAADTKADSKADKDAPGFNDLDKNNDGKLSKSEAAGNPTLAARFAEVDGDSDGSVSRMEYLKTMAAKDFRSLREKTADIVDPGKKTETGSGAARGSSK